MKSPVAKRSIVLGGHKTSVSLEDPFWIALKEIAKERAITLSNLVGGIDTGRQQENLSSAIRLFVLDHFRTRLSRLSLDRAGEGKIPEIMLIARQAG
jgi:predicted DNA-binding ribbon-helix-helix protein